MQASGSLSGHFIDKEDQKISLNLKLSLSGNELSESSSGISSIGQRYNIH